MNISVYICFPVENRKRIVWELSLAANSEENKENAIEDERKEGSEEWENKEEYFCLLLHGDYVIVT